MNRLEKIILLVLFTAVTACNASTESDDPVSSDASAKTEVNVNSEPLEITWEQLMPKGEEDKLEELYSNYYAELERKFQEDIDALADGKESTDAGSGGQDIASLISEGSANDTMDQIGTFNVVEELDGVKIRLPGYVVPFDFSADSNYREFLLVPYFGACLHTPPPPPNQIVFVKAEQAATIASIYEPVWVEGVLKTGRFDSELANSAYELELDKVEAYAY